MSSRKQEGELGTRELGGGLGGGVGGAGHVHIENRCPQALATLKCACSYELFFVCLLQAQS